MRLVHTGAQPFMPQMLATGSSNPASALPALIETGASGIATEDVANIAADRMVAAAKAASTGFCIDFLFALQDELGRANIRATRGDVEQEVNAYGERNVNLKAAPAIIPL